MAKQCGTFFITGTIDDVSYYKTRHGYLARMKTGVSSKRFKTDPKFARSRENAREFGRASAAGGVLRRALRRLMRGKHTDSKLIGRITSLMVQVLQGDPIHTRGDRRVQDGDLCLLRGLELQSETSLTAALPLDIRSEIDRNTHTAIVHIPAFSPASDLPNPAGATHFHIVSSCIIADFENRKSQVRVTQSETVSLHETEQQPINLTFDHFDALSTIHPCFLVLGIRYYQEVNGEMNLLADDNHQTLSIVAVDSTIQASQPKSPEAQQAETQDHRNTKVITPKDLGKAIQRSRKPISRNPHMQRYENTKAINTRQRRRLIPTGWTS